MDDLEIARLLADVADEMPQRSFRTDLEQFEKDDGTFATAADLGIEDELRH